MAFDLDLILPVARAVAILAVAWLTGRWLRHLLGRIPAVRLDPTFRTFLLSISWPVVLIVALPIALEAVGVSITSFIALLSTAGLAIALALKESLSNVASGAILLATRPFALGDAVTLAGVTGKVRRMRMLTVELDTPDGRRVNVTNDKVLAAPMEVHAAEGRVRVEVLVRIPRASLDASLLDALHRTAASVTAGTAAADAVVPLEFEGDLVRVAVHVWAPSARAHEARAALILGLHRALPSPPTA